MTALHKIPYEEINANGDRSYSLRVLNEWLIATQENDDRSEMVDTLHRLEDPRTFSAIEAVLYDSHRPAWMREDASQIFVSMGFHPGLTQQKLLELWNSDDIILQEHALTQMKSEHADLIRTVARDNQHPLQRDALRAMEWNFSSSVDQKIKLAAIAHSDANIRRLAAWLFYWDEPLCAEEALLRAAADSDESVAERACATLEYYPTQKIFLRLTELSKHKNPVISAKAKESASIIHEEFSWALGDEKKSSTHIKKWLAPIWKTLHFSEAELLSSTDDNSQHTSVPKVNDVRPTPLTPPAIQELLSLLQNPDLSIKQIRQLFRSTNWTLYTRTEKDQLSALFLNHPDEVVVENSLLFFAAIGDVKSLLDRTKSREGSPSWRVKDAFYKLSLLDNQDITIAEEAWIYLKKHALFESSVNGEALNAYVKHASKNEAIPRLLELAKNLNLDEGLRVCAIEHLATLKASVAIDQLLSGFIDSPPIVTWNLHIALLEAAVELELVTTISENSIQRLLQIDHLDLQVALGMVLSP